MWVYVVVDKDHRGPEDSDGPEHVQDRPGNTVLRQDVPAGAADHQLRQPLRQELRQQARAPRERYLDLPRGTCFDASRIGW